MTSVMLAVTIPRSYRMQSFQRQPRSLPGLALSLNSSHTEGGPPAEDRTEPDWSIRASANGPTHRRLRDGGLLFTGRHGSRFVHHARKDSAKYKTDPCQFDY